MFLFVVDEHQQYKQQGEAKSPPNYNQDSLLPFFLDLVKDKKNTIKAGGSTATKMCEWVMGE